MKTLESYFIETWTFQCNVAIDHFQHVIQENNLEKSGKIIWESKSSSVGQSFIRFTKLLITVINSGDDMEEKVLLGTSNCPSKFLNYGLRGNKPEEYLNDKKKYLKDMKII